MTREERCNAHYEEFKQRDEALRQEYESKYAEARDYGTPEDILKVNDWHNREETRLEAWLIQGFLNIAK